MWYISNDNFLKLMETIKNEYEIFVPVRRGNHRFYKKYSSSLKLYGTEESLSEDTIVIGEVRAFEPLKAFFSHARERVAEGFTADLPHSDKKPYCIVGVKACDLKGFRVMDFVFKDHDFEDPFYTRGRENNLIISADCTCAIDTCFCLALDLKPHPQVDFDMNLSQVSGGFVVTAGSQKGETLIERESSLFEEAKEKLTSEMEEQRLRVIEEVKKNIKENSIPQQDRFKTIIQKNYDSPIWSEEAKTCVECGACNTICPTCHCFLLYDQSDKKKMQRLRVWDSCMIKDFAKVAAGVNPRPLLWMRLRNRFEKKFDFFPQVADVYACTGCGRCISACPAKIDIRKVLQRLVKDVKKQPV